jgi:hypothetical protein
MSERPGPAAGDSVRALRRVVGEAGRAELLDLLAEELPGADLTTLLLEVFRRRADRLSPADVLRRYRQDRFVSPATVDFAALRRAEDAMLGALPDDFEALVLAPVLPLGAHTATGDVDPRNVIATIRGTEVAADPTNGLALEAAVRRAALLRESRRSAAPVRLAASQRVIRAQAFTGPISFAHFQLFGMVTAGRDTGSQSFERQHLAEHLAAAVRGLAALAVGPVVLAITCLDEPSLRVLAAMQAAFAGHRGVEVRAAPERESGRTYYRGLCFKVFASSGAERIEVGDGGFVDWTARLLASKKERLLISGYGLDRLAIMGDAQPLAQRGS